MSIFAIRKIISHMSIVKYGEMMDAIQCATIKMCIRDSLETSGTAQFAYAVLKGVRLGYLPKRMAAWAEKAFYCLLYTSRCV